MIRPTSEPEWSSRITKRMVRPEMVTGGVGNSARGWTFVT